MMRTVVFFTATVICAGASLSAQRPVAGQIAVALSAERRGDFQRAVEGFFAVLSERPTDGQAILGLSRVLPPLDRRVELLAPLQQALAVDSNNIGFLSLAVRTTALLGDHKRARQYVEQWSRLVVGEEQPFREWAQSALEARDAAAAREALELGRQRIDHPAALAPDLAQLRQAEGDFSGAAAEWLRAVVNVPTFRASALLLLGNLLPPARDSVLAVLSRSDEAEGTRLRALLLIGWGEPVEGVTLLREAAPDSYEDALSIFRLVFDELKGRTDAPANRARAMALEFRSEYESDESRVRTRMDAARAWADAGEEEEARRLLAMVATDPAAPDGVATSASSTLLGVLLAEDKPAEAESLLVSLKGALSLDEWDRDARRVAMAWARTGDIERGEALLTIDSSVTGFDVRGRLRAFAGDLVMARNWLRVAGPFDIDREKAATRARLLTLLMFVEQDTLPALGAALLTLERGDTAAAVEEFSELASEVTPKAGGALWLLAGELAVARADTTGALLHLEAADRPDAPAVAPSARLLRARILAEHGEIVRAREMLESIIFDFPDSAVLPAARRLRDAMRGAIPS